MEVPFLACSSILSLEHKISSDIINVSTSSESRDHMEVNIDLKSVVFVPFTGSWFTLPVLDIDKIPLLALSAMEGSHVDISVFSINTT
jgi:hypothetical protein